MNRFRVFILTAAVMLFAWTAQICGEEAGDSLFGYYSDPYYINEVFGFQLKVPYDYTIMRPDSDASTALSEAKADLQEYRSARVFDGSRQYAWDNIHIEVYSPEASALFLVNEGGIYGEEQENAEKYEEYYRANYESYESYTDVATKVDRLEFAGGSHPAALFRYTLNQSDGSSRQICQMNLFLRSLDGRYLCIIRLESDDPLQMETMCGYFSQCGADSSAEDFAADDLSRMELAEAGKLHVGVANESPFVISNGDGTFSGIGVEVLQKIAQKLDLELVTEEVGNENLVPYLTSGSLDVITSGFEMAYREEENLRFTQPVYTEKEAEGSEIHITIYPFAISGDHHYLYEAVNGALLELLQDKTVDEILSRYLG